MKPFIIYHPGYAAQTAITSMRKLTPIANEVKSLGIGEFIDPEAFDSYQEVIPALKNLHDPDYVEAVLSGKGDLARSAFNEWSPEIRDGVMRMNYGMLLAMQHLERRIVINLAQGFHHAVYEQGMGFCTFNGLALVASAFPKKSIFVLDCDQHGGNGTEDFAARLPNLFNFTINGSSFDCKPKTTRSISINLQRNQWPEYQSALNKALDLIDEQRPDVVIYQAGVDCHEGDPFGTLQLSTSQLRSRDEFVIRSIFQKGIPLIVTLAGGYQEPIETKLLGLHLQTVLVASEVLSEMK